MRSDFAMSKPIARLYYYETQSSENHTCWDLTTDKQVAMQGYNMKDATVQDLDDFGCIGGIFDGVILNIAEGFYEWNSEAITYDNGETYGDYEVVWDLKDRVLDRMEQLDLENTVEYENIIGWNDWKIKSMIDMGECSFLN
jgi:hypothetical protein